MLKVNYKKLHKDARLMTAAKEGDAGHDIGFVEIGQNGKRSGHIDEKGNKVYYTGIAIEMEPVKELLRLGLRPQAFGFLKSSIHKVFLALTNGVGTIDFGYRGEIMFLFKPTLVFTNENTAICPTIANFDLNEWCGQLIFIPCFDTEISEREFLSNTSRGSQGYGDATNQRSNEKKH